MTARRVPGPTRTLAFLATAFVVCDMVVKFMVNFLIGAIANPHGDAALLWGYLFYLPPRLELWLLFTAVIASAASVLASARTGGLTVPLLCSARFCSPSWSGGCHIWAAA